MNSASGVQRAIVTGASSGIGRETALAFAQAGIDVALVGRQTERLEPVAAQARQHGVEAKPYTADLAALESVRERMAAIVADFTPVDGLINNAGMGYTNALSETSLADWQQVMDLNLTSPFQCIQGVLPEMRARGQGTIVNVSSIAAQHAFPGWGPYNVSKAGLIALSKTLAGEEKSHGIRVMTVSPGPVNTPLWDSDTVQADLDRNAMLTPQAVAQSILQAALLPDHAVVEEMTLMPSAGAL
ncbi:MAG: short-chain dehydrogenase [Cyanobacteria bacterium QS_8_64_29]|nr:MAG: short-chain dehydrogenase [Cyanobacteria bacterium QS_8_64_29]